VALRTLKPLKAGRLPTQAAQTLRHAILAGDIPLGSPLREAHLARQLNVSQTTIREALVHLGQLGLVVRSPHRDTVVTKLNHDEVGDRLVIRLLLEGLAWEEASRRMTDADFEELDQRLERIRELSTSTEFADLAEVELEFHCFIWEKSGNPTLRTVLEQLTPPLFVYVTQQRRAQKKSGSRQRYKRHREVVDALRSGARTQIHDTLRQHLVASYGRLAEPSESVMSIVRNAVLASRPARKRSR
jgi:DNA-binding GntR family transcriptional regulator